MNGCFLRMKRRTGNLLALNIINNEVNIKVEPRLAHSADT